MSPELKLILFYIVGAIICTGLYVLMIKIDPKHEEMAKEAYKKRLIDELKRIG